MNSNERSNLSRTLSKILRHKAEDEGLSMRSDGFIALNELLARPKLIKLGATLEQVQEVVEKDAKTRFTLRTEPDGLYWIRANQGHSIVVEDLELTEITNPDLYPTVLHGTYRTVYSAIRASGGLKRMKRTHIHLATGKFGEEGVRSGVRKSCDLFIHIDLAAAMRDGIKFFVSSNGVILTTGVDGLLSDKYFSKIESTEQLESSVSALSIDSPLSQTGQRTRSKRRRLFGGCLSTLLPDNLLDASDFRQIPDSQEVFLHPDRQERSIVIDLTESIEGPAADDGVAVVTEHFKLLGRENEAQDIEISRSMAVVPADLDARQWVTAILQGTQTVSKFNRGERQGERIVMTIGLVRLPKVQTDVLITHHSSAGGDDDMDEAYAVVRDAVQHFQVDDWKLFPEEAEPGYEVWA